MNSLFFFLILHMILSVISGIAEGGGGVITTTLSSELSATSTNVQVVSTAGFVKRDYIVIGDEYIKYFNKDDTSFDASYGFLGASSGRGWNDTEAVVHPAGTKVYSSDADPLNAALGFNVLATDQSVGAVDLITVGRRFIDTTLPRFVTWDYGILQVGFMTYVRTVLQLLGGAFLVYLGLNMVGAFGRDR